MSTPLARMQMAEIIYDFEVRNVSKGRARESPWVAEHRRNNKPNKGDPLRRGFHHGC